MGACIDISIEEATKIIRGFAISAFTEDREIDDFVAITKERGLLLNWGRELHPYYYLDSRLVSDRQEPEFFGGIAKQIFRQVATVRTKGSESSCTPEEAGLIIAFTIGVISRVIRDWNKRYKSIVSSFAEELRALCTAQKIGPWKDIELALNLVELRLWEEELGAGINGEEAKEGEIIEFQNESPIEKLAGLVWNSNPKKLKTLSEILETDLAWIVNGAVWVEFFKDGGSFLGTLRCKNQHQEKIGLLILMLKECKKMKSIGGKAFWGKISKHFVGETLAPWTKDWAKMSSAAKNNERILRLFYLDIKPLLERLEIEKDDIRKFLRKIELENEED